MARLGLAKLASSKYVLDSDHRWNIAHFAQIPAISSLFQSGGWVGGEVGNKAKLSLASASLLGLSLAIR